MSAKDWLIGIIMLAAGFLFGRAWDTIMAWIADVLAELMRYLTYAVIIVGVGFLVFAALHWGVHAI